MLIERLLALINPTIALLWETSCDRDCQYHNQTTGTVVQVYKSNFH